MVRNLLALNSAGEVASYGEAESDEAMISGDQSFNLDASGTPVGGGGILSRARGAGSALSKARSRLSSISVLGKSAGRYGVFF